MSIIKNKLLVFLILYLNYFQTFHKLDICLNILIGIIFLVLIKCPPNLQLLGTKNIRCVNLVQIKI